MHIILIIFGLLLLLFGGGCTLIALVMMIDEPNQYLEQPWGYIALLDTAWVAAADRRLAAVARGNKIAPGEACGRGKKLAFVVLACRMRSDPQPDRI